jgi:siroheme synthase (precorrin-2 oxidase/ferrochelatase)
LLLHAIWAEGSVRERKANFKETKERVGFLRQLFERRKCKKSSDISPETFNVDVHFAIKIVR